jgi:hypothetical protein
VRETYQYFNFWVSTRAIGCGGGFHLLRVLLIGAHHFAVTSIVGVVKPMKPTVELAWPVVSSGVGVSGGEGEGTSIPECASQLGLPPIVPPMVAIAVKPEIFGEKDMTLSGVS